MKPLLKLLTECPYTKQFKIVIPGEQLTIMAKQTKHIFLPKDYLFCGTGHSNDLLVNVVCGKIALVVPNPLFGVN